MPERKFRPSIENLGKPCMYWQVAGGRFNGCNYPRRQFEGETKCGGFIQTACLPPKPLTSSGPSLSDTERHIALDLLRPKTVQDIDPTDSNKD